MPTTANTQGEILAKVIETLSLEMDFQKICHHATSITMEVLGADLSTLALPTEPGPLRFRYFWGFPPDCDTAKLPPVTPGTLMAFASGKTFFVPDYDNYPGALAEFVRLGVKTGYAAPLWLGGEVIGVLTLAWRKHAERPSEHQSRLVEAVLRQVAFAYQRETLINDLSKSRAELRQHRDNLQQLVAERTADLLHAKEEAEKAMREAKLAEEHNRYLALNDALTRLPNRVLLLERLNLALGQARRTGKTLAVLFLDLDRFKNINDSLGHIVGDELLCEVARRLTRCVRETDTVSRQGGDEFVILLPEVSDPDDVVEVAEKLLAIVSQPYRLEGYEMRVTHSIGIALFPDHGSDAQELMRKADTAMYRAKEVGRNNYQFFSDDIARTTLSRMSLEVDMRRAIERHEFEVYYQPLIELSHRRMVGIEALVRWNHPQLGVLLPGQFIALAEDTGLIAWLGQQVLEESCAQVARMNGTHGVRLPVSINLSAAQLERPDFIQTVCDVLEKFSLDPQCLKFELTESMLMRHTEHITAQLLALSRMGIQLALDDFGTHYSSLTYLKRFPVDTLKIDRSFVQEIVSDPEDAAISRAIIGMGHSLGMRIVAEGVETAEQLRILEVFGCDVAQGDFFGKPMSAVDLDATLNESRFPLEKAVAGCGRQPAE